MATEEDLKKAEEEAEEAAEALTAPLASTPSTAPAETAPARTDGASTSAVLSESSAGDLLAEDDVPVQLGYQRYVYAAYMAGAMLAGFLVAKSGHAGWYKLGQWKPELGEPKDEIIYPIAGLIGVFIAVFYWRKPSSRQYANEVAEELSKVSWPSREEVTNSTTVVVLTTVFATIFFAVMDRFWGFITDKIYTF